MQNTQRMALASVLLIISSLVSFAYPFGEWTLIVWGILLSIGTYIFGYDMGKDSEVKT